MRLINNLSITKDLDVPNLSLNDKDEALKAAIKELGLRETKMKGVYCELHNPNMPKGNYSNQRHYVWNETTQQMEELPGIYYISADGRDVNGSVIPNACLQAGLQGYEFTETNGVFTKDGKNYTYNAQTNRFEEITDNNGTTKTDDISSVIDKYEEVVDSPDETVKEPALLPKKEVAREERHDYGNGYYSIMQLDADGYLVEETFYNPDGSVESTIEYEYYDDGSSKSIKQYADGTTNVNIYNAQGQNIGHEYYDNDGTLRTKIRTEYNADGSFTTTSDEFLDEGVEHSVSEYDSNHRMLSATSVKPDGTVTNTKCYNYENGIELYVETNEAGEVVSILASNGDFTCWGNVSNIDDIKKYIEFEKQQIENTQLAYSYLDYPIPPNPSFITDPVEYDKAMKEYNDALKHYDELSKDLNEKLYSLQLWLDHYENELLLIDFVNNTSEIEKNINELRANGDNEAADKLQEKLDKQREEFAKIYAEKESKSLELENLLSERNELPKPYSPDKDDYKTDVYTGTTKNGKNITVKINDNGSYTVTKSTVGYVAKEAGYIDASFDGCKTMSIEDAKTLYINSEAFWIGLTGLQETFSEKSEEFTVVVSDDGKTFRFVRTSDLQGNPEKVKVYASVIDEYEEVVENISSENIELDENGNIKSITLPNGEIVNLSLNQVFDEVGYDNAMKEYQEALKVYEDKCKELDKQIAEAKKADAEIKTKLENIVKETADGLVEKEPQKLPVKEVAREERQGNLVSQYDADGKIIKRTSYNPDGSIIYETEYEYYDDGSCKHIETFSDGTKTIYTFDKQGRYIKSESYDRNGKLEWQLERKFNADGSHTEIIDDYWLGGHTHTVSEYDAEYRMLSATSTKPDGTVTNTKCYNYENGVHLYIERNEAGEVVGIGSGDEQSGYSTYFENFDKVKNSIKDLEERIENVKSKFKDLDYPIPPNRYIITDEAEYAKELEEYIDAKRQYDEECKKINEELTSLNYWLQHEENILLTVNFANNIDAIEKDIAELRAKGENIKADFLQAELDEQIKEFANNLVIKGNTESNLYDLYIKRNDLSIPQPPKKSEYIDENGDFDELKYDNAMKEYNEAKKEYDIECSLLDKQIAEAKKANAEAKAKLKKLAENKDSIETKTYYGRTINGRNIKVTIDSDGNVKVQKLLKGPDGNYLSNAENSEIIYNSYGEVIGVVLPNGEEVLLSSDE